MNTRQNKIYDFGRKPIMYLVFLVIFITSNLYAVDTSLIYKDAMDINVTIFENGSGNQSFSVTRRQDNKNLRKSFDTEVFYYDKSAEGLDISYVINKASGGVDIVYTVKNLTASPQELPWFQVQGLCFSTSDNLSALDPRAHVGTLVRRSQNEENFVNYNWFWLSTYPSIALSPVMAICDDDFAMGTSLCYPVLEYEQSPKMNLYYIDSGTMAGTWRFIYEVMNDLGTYTRQTIDAGKTYNYTLTVRFSDPRYWLLTLQPYKDYFQNLYPLNSNQRDTRPIKGYILAHPTSVTNYLTSPRGYRDDRRIDINGLDTFIDNVVDECNDFGYKRTMLWTFNGCYNNYLLGVDRWSINYPPQFMSDLLPEVTNSLSALDKFSQNNINLGLWWGRSGQTPPLPALWNPTFLNPFVFSNNDQRQFMENELMLAKNRGVNEIGLDAFKTHWEKDRMQWIDRMKEIAPNINFASEGGGYATADYIFSKISIFCNPDFTITTGPSVWANYIHPNGEIKIYLTSSVTTEYIQDLVSWGFTPLVMEQNVDIRGITLTRCVTADGIDNDGDGLTDWPYDLGCDSPIDNTESPINLTEICYEDAEDGLKKRWEVIDNDPPGATIDNVYDSEKDSRVISLYSVNGNANAYRLPNINEENRFVVTWDLKASNLYYIDVLIDTVSHGTKYIVYHFDTNPSSVSGNYIKPQLDPSYIDNSWHTIIRDIQADVTEIVPGITVKKIISFMVFGNAKIDNLVLYKNISDIDNSWKHRIRNRWTDDYLYDAGDRAGYGNDPSDNTYLWYKKNVGDNKIRIENVSTGDVLHLQHDHDFVECTYYPDNYDSSHWELSDAIDDYKIIECAWSVRPDRIHIEHKKGYAEHSSTIPETAWSSHWEFELIR